mmetsp:Transcript_1830/g.4602  ORF Transcript_1830/g.4602 Transcript_1830/m.4602 type:complete len:207 (-) Transcript_1830:1070-1690(-)
MHKQPPSTVALLVQQTQLTLLLRLGSELVSLPPQGGAHRLPPYDGQGHKVHQSTAVDQRSCTPPLESRGPCSVQKMIASVWTSVMPPPHELMNKRMLTVLHPHLHPQMESPDGWSRAIRPTAHLILLADGAHPWSRRSCGRLLQCLVSPDHCPLLQRLLFPHCCRRPAGLAKSCFLNSAQFRLAALDVKAPRLEPVPEQDTKVSAA